MRTNYDTKNLISNLKNIRTVWIWELRFTPCEESGVYIVLLEEPESTSFQEEFDLIGLIVPEFEWGVGQREVPLYPMLGVQLRAETLNSWKFNCLVIPATGRALPEEGPEHPTGRRRRGREEEEGERNDKEKNTLLLVIISLLINDKIKNGKNTPNSKFVFSYAPIIYANSKVCRFIIITTTTVKH